MFWTLVVLVAMPAGKHRRIRDRGVGLEHLQRCFFAACQWSAVLQAKAEVIRVVTIALRTMRH